jgi:hypothetical protein
VRRFGPTIKESERPVSLAARDWLLAAEFSRLDWDDHETCTRKSPHRLRCSQPKRRRRPNRPRDPRVRATRLDNHGMRVEQLLCESCLVTGSSGMRCKRSALPLARGGIAVVMRTAHTTQFSLPPTAFLHRETPGQNAKDAAPGLPILRAASPRGSARRDHAMKGSRGRTAPG